MVSYGNSHYIGLLTTVDSINAIMGHKLKLSQEQASQCVLYRI